MGCDSKQSVKTPRLGFLATGSREGRAFLIAGLLQGLRDLGYVEGQNIQIEYRFSNEQDDRLPALADELVAQKVDIILASGTPATFAAQRATTTIPIVMPASAADPVATGLITSFVRPGGNITGLSALTATLAGKRLELLRAIVPDLKRVAVFWNPTSPTYGPVLAELEAVAPALNVPLQRVEVRIPEDFPGAFEAALRQRADAMLVPADPLTTNRQARVAELALQARLPTMMEFKQFVLAGGLLSYGVNIVDLYRRSASYVDKIVKGAKPADLPVQQPEVFDFALNLTTAQALGLAIPGVILAQATEVIS
jgi:putative ABC transport system substrate-binding protein